MPRSRSDLAKSAAAQPGISRRGLLAAATSLAALGPAAVSAQVDRRNAQASWVLQRLSGFETSGVILVRIFRGYFPALNPDRFNFLFNRYSHIVLSDIAEPELVKPDVTKVPIEAFRAHKQ